MATQALHDHEPEAYGILYGDVDPGESAAAHRTLDVAGHYGRPDVFCLTIDRSPRSPATFEGS